MKDPDSIARDIDATRRELHRTLDALQAKTAVVRRYPIRVGLSAGLILGWLSVRIFGKALSRRAH